MKYGQAKGTQSKEKVQMAVRLDPEDFEKVRALAESNGIGVSTQMRVLIKKGLAA